VGQVRRDVRIMANDLLAELEPLRELLLPVRILGGRARAAACARWNGAQPPSSA
jgi:hypothetical protein